MQINIKLSKNFQTQFNKMREKYGEEFLKLNGLDEDTLNYTSFIDNFIDSDNVANASIDANSNISQKDIVTLLSEMSKPHQKLLAYNKIYHEINKKYGFKTANEWLEKQFSYSLYMHDFNTTTFYPYCFAADMKDLAERGLFFISNYNAQPAKHLDSFVQFIMEWVSYLSRRQSGAVGMPNLIPYLYYYWSRDVKQGYYVQSPEKYARQQIQALIYRLNQPWVRSDQASFTNVSIFDHPYFEAIFGGAEFPDGELMIDEEEEIIEFQKTFMDVVNEIRETNVFTFPVITTSLLRKNDKFVDEEFAKWACDMNRKWLITNFFIDDSVTSLSNCCRLKSNITDMGYFNSIGGAALKVGSVKVSTLNLARLAYEHKTEKEYLIALRDLTELDLKALDCVRYIIQRNIEKGLLPNFQEGLLDMKSLYNTVGINGIFETMKTFGYVYEDEFGNTYYKQEAYDFGKRIFEVLHNVADNFKLDKDYMINFEQIPGEQCSAKFQQADKLMYPDDVVDVLPLYGNQWIPLGIKTTILERTKICAAFDQYCNGGSIEHINCDAPFDTFEKAWELLQWVAAQGVTYFAFNGKVSQCEDHHSFYGNTCPYCGKPKAIEYTRTVGFYTPTYTWSAPRKEEFKMREWHALNTKGAEA